MYLYGLHEQTDIKRHHNIMPLQKLYLTTGKVMLLIEVIQLQRMALHRNRSGD